MSVKSGLEFFILNFTEPLQSLPLKKLNLVIFIILLNGEGGIKVHIFVAFLENMNFTDCFRRT